MKISLNPEAPLAQLYRQARALASEGTARPGEALTLSETSASAVADPLAPGEDPASGRACSPRPTADGRPAGRGAGRRSTARDRGIDTRAGAGAGRRSTRSNAAHVPRHRRRRTARGTAARKGDPPPGSPTT